MATLAEIYNWFMTAKKPTQAQFWASWGSFYHKLEKIPVSAIEGLSNVLNSKADKAQFDAHKVAEDAHEALFQAKQDTLESGINIKTVNGESILGEGDIEVESSSEGYYQSFVEPVTNTIDSFYEDVFDETLDLTQFPVGTVLEFAYFFKANILTSSLIQVKTEMCGSGTVNSFSGQIDGNYYRFIATAIKTASGFWNIYRELQSYKESTRATAFAKLTTINSPENNLLQLSIASATAGTLTFTGGYIREVSGVGSSGEGSGADGADGENGASAYEVAVTNGFVGTEPEWLESLKGEPGEAGGGGSDLDTVLAAGDEASGKNMKLNYNSAGNEGHIKLNVSQTQSNWESPFIEIYGNDDGGSFDDSGVKFWKNRLQFTDNVTPANNKFIYYKDLGNVGEDGVDGLSAYEVAVENGFIGTEAEWLASLKGEDGADGEAGPNGTNGTNGVDGNDGLSAYQIAVANGFVGTEIEWLESLQGSGGGGDLDDVLGAGEIASNKNLQINYNSAGNYGHIRLNTSQTLSDWESPFIEIYGNNDGGSFDDSGVKFWKNRLQFTDNVTPANNKFIYYKDLGNVGEDGVDGLSAYEVAVENGFIGTEAEWLASLKGEPGADGDINTINSTVTGEPTGSGIIPNIVYITQANYDAAVIAETIVSTTFYVITDA